MTAVALIPARSGSKRLPDKNIKKLNGKPLMAYTIEAALESKEFDHIICVTDSEKYAQTASKYGATVPCLRPAYTSGDTSPDIHWVEWVLNTLKKHKIKPDLISILRPTSPFRTASTIKRAKSEFIDGDVADSLRAIQKVKEHPGKMWVLQEDRILPLMPFSIDNTPWHSNQYANLPEIYVQNASIEMAWTKTVVDYKSISGRVIKPFFTTGIEGFDINHQEDWLLAQYYMGQK